MPTAVTAIAGFEIFRDPAAIARPPSSSHPSSRPEPVTDRRRAPIRRTRDIPPINENIRFPEVRVIDTDGAQLGVMSPAEARRLAEAQDLDLVVVSDKASPPVCRIADYGKFKFEQEKRAREAKRRQHAADVKEVKMRYKIDEHDYQVRLKAAERFLKAGDKVKATITFRGREIQHASLAEGLLRQMMEDLEAVAEVQQAPKREGRNMMMMLSPKKDASAKEKERDREKDREKDRAKAAAKDRPRKADKTNKADQTDNAGKTDRRAAEVAPSEVAPSEAEPAESPADTPPAPPRPAPERPIRKRKAAEVSIAEPGDRGASPAP